MEEESKNLAEETAASDDSQKNEQTEQPAGDTATTDEVADEQVSISKSELEKIQKKAKDFDGIVGSKKQDKLLKKFRSNNNEEEEEETPVIDQDAIMAEATRVAEETALRVANSAIQEELKNNVISASDEWLKENPWADNDDVFSSIISNIKPTSSNKKEDILAELDRAAFNASPSQYLANRDEKIKAKLLTEQNKINVGSGGSAPSVKKDIATDIDVNAEDQRIADRYFGGDLQRYMKYKEKNNNN